MAIQVYDPLSAAAGYFKRPIDSHGKLRILYGKMVAAIAGDIGSTINLGKLPPGAVRLMYSLCAVKCSAWGAGATLNIGYSAYRSKQDQQAANDGIEAGSANAIASALDMSASAVKSFNAALIKWDFYSLAGVSMIGTVAGAVIPL